MTDTFKFSKKWIKKRHSINEIRMWLSELEFFRYFRAFGGHMNDGDTFKMCFKFNKIDELIIIMESLNFQIRKATINIENEYDIISSEYEKVEEYPDFIKPGIQESINVNWFLWIDKNQLIISIAGTGTENNFDVTENDFKKCQEMEFLIKKKKLTDKIDKHFNHKSGCISVENYPHIFKNIN